MDCTPAPRREGSILNANDYHLDSQVRMILIPDTCGTCLWNIWNVYTVNINVNKVLCNIHAKITARPDIH